MKNFMLGNKVSRSKKKIKRKFYIKLKNKKPLYKKKNNLKWKKI
ncbi:MAG: hypothetical protein ACSHUF_00365 [Candidatus Nasuia deltocephalinicola]